MQPQPRIAISSRKLLLTEILQLRDMRNAVLAESCLQRSARTADEADWLVAQKGQRFGATDDGKPARLVELGGELGQELVEAQSNGNGNSDCRFDLLRQRGHRFGRWHTVQALRSREVEIGLVE